MGLNTARGTHIEIFEADPNDDGVVHLFTIRNAPHECPACHTAELEVTLESTGDNLKTVVPPGEKILLTIRIARWLTAGGFPSRAKFMVPV